MIRRAIVILGLLAPVVAVGQTAAPFAAPLIGPGGIPVKNFEKAAKDDAACDKCPTLSIGELIALALDAPPKDDRGQPVTDFRVMFRRHDLGVKIASGAKTALDAAEVALVEKAAGEYLAGRPNAGSFVAQIVRVVDPNFDPK